MNNASTTEIPKINGKKRKIYLIFSDWSLVYVVLNAILKIIFGLTLSILQYNFSSDQIPWYSHFPGYANGIASIFSAIADILLGKGFLKFCLFY